MMLNAIQVSRVINCYDGDTFRVDLDSWPKFCGYHMPVRIRGINCPERNSTDPAVRAVAEMAALHTRTALTNAKRIILRNVSRGKYFRLIANVDIDGSDLGEQLIQAGLAVPYHI